MDALTAIQGDIPAWSGEFWVHDEFGYLSIHCADTRQHQPPERGWVLVRILVECGEDAEVFAYRKVGGEGLEHYDHNLHHRRMMVPDGE